MTDIAIGSLVVTGLGVIFCVAVQAWLYILRSIARAYAWLTLPAELRSTNPDLSKHKTIIDILREEGIEVHDSDVTWRLGAAARDLYQSKYNRPPTKTLRPKTKGQGSHDIAGYPPQIHDDLPTLVWNMIDEVMV